MNRFKTILVVILACILQFTILSRIKIFNVSANIFIPIIVAFALGFGFFRASYAGLVMGLIGDILFSPILGPQALFYFLIGFIISDNSYRFNVKDYRTGALLTGMATFFFYLISLIVAYFINMNIVLNEYLINSLVGIIINSVLYYPVIKIFTRIFVFPDIVFYR